MDISDALLADSDRINGDDLIGGPRTVTIVSAEWDGDNKKPAKLGVAEFPDRKFMPCKTVLRIIAGIWGKETDVWIGRKLTLYRDPDVKFGGDAVGGVRVSHMSHIEKRMVLKLAETRGKKGRFIVEPLAVPQIITSDAVAEFNSRIAAASTREELDTVSADLQAWELGAFRDELKSAWSKRLADIKANPAPADGKAS
ncbi:hypothetical protein M2272_005900 [Mycobacterium frederiksbergense]|uniref:Uncharacterized protein n=1 Tax=Mycolicibacterium frederiksbergense TaxID=117567 RepID=A0ABT6LAH3_9MYCO|nr:hypothetical protein [Mycolicibacterium frederiksbergense]MDH6199232.1 hypothetical protein [Mycolicibacterium frederiksbergense]